MDRNGLVELVSEKNKLCMAEAREIVDYVIDGVIDAMKIDGEVRITGFGCLYTDHREERLGRNPKNGEKILISARDVIRFKPGSFLKNAIGDKSND